MISFNVDRITRSVSSLSLGLPCNKRRVTMRLIANNFPADAMKLLYRCLLYLQMYKRGRVAVFGKRPSSIPIETQLFSVSARRADLSDIIERVYE